MLFPKTTNLWRWWAYLQSYFLKSHSSRTNLVAVSTDTVPQGSGRELDILFQLWSLDFAGSSCTDLVSYDLVSYTAMGAGKFEGKKDTQ